MITGEQVKEAMKAKQITQVEHHRCSFCAYPCRYIRAGDELFFDLGCDCIRGSAQRLELRSWESAAEWINLQSDSEIKLELANKFGIAA